MTIERFGEVYKRRGLKVNSNKSKEVVLGGEKRPVCEFGVDGRELEHGSNFMYEITYESF